MKLLVIFSILLGLGESLDLGTVLEIDELMVFIKGAGNRLSEATDELDAVEIDGKKNYAEIIDKYLLEIDHTDKDGEDYQKLKNLVEKIDQAWSDLGKKDPGDDDKTQLAALAKTRDELYDLYLGDGSTEGLSVQIASAELPHPCNFTVPEQLRLRRLHQVVVFSELRAFVLSLKAEEDSQKSVAKGILHSEEYILASKLGFTNTDDTYRACDPPEHIRGKTFGEFLGLFQGMVVNNGHISTNWKPSQCSTTCDALDNDVIDKCYTRKAHYGNKDHCHKKKCSGRLFDCITVHDVETCELGENSDRRFPWAYTIYSHQMYGKDEGRYCEGEIVKILENDDTYKKCLNCLCVCAEEAPYSKAIRSVSLLPQFSNIQKNMIVTGVRFQENQKMFHVQIEESKLGPLGEIVPGTSKWKKLGTFFYNGKTGSFEIRKGLSKQLLYDNLNYKTFKSDSRRINLDKVKTPIGEVIVGVSLRYNEEDDAVEIQILSWPFDFKTGELKDPIDLNEDPLEHDWITWENSPRRSNNYDNKRFRIKLLGLDDPILAPYNPIYSDPNDQLRIRATGFGVDMGQHTIPYITLQDVTYPEIKAPLGGLELYYARAKGYGGFVGFKIQNYDFVNIFQDEMTQDDIDKYKADYNQQLVREIPVKSM